MDYAGKTVAITGGARGIGFAMGEAFRAHGAKVALADLEGAEAAAERLAGYGATVDVREESQIAAFIDETERRLGPIAVYVSNAGVLRTDEPTMDAAGADDAAWRLSFEINVMGAVRGARQVWPRMRGRGGGVFVVTASAAGLLSLIGAASYTATKHAAVAFAESLAITHGDEGLRVVCVCPQGVRTDMLSNTNDNRAATADGVVEPADVARETIAAIAEQRFLALPHPPVAQYEQLRARERDQWLDSMRNFRRGLMKGPAGPA
ncbi:MAG: SDR family NAD(P)-dependent oxidoreductase [Caulobacterales bacterium]|nr:SDR family NAD(P)-dependent oxidoreductase [Caulobacterales bacterium]